MRRLRIALATLLLGASVTHLAAQSPAPARPRGPRPPDLDAQGQPAPAPPPAAPNAEASTEPPDDFDIVFERGTRDAIRIGQDYGVAAGDAVRDAVVILGNATIAGQVDRDLVVILGTVRLASTAVIGGNFVAIGGNAAVESGARVRRDAVVVGGKLDAPADFMPGGEYVVIGSGLVGDWIGGLVPYISRGLVWGRLIVPGLPWVWGVVMFFFLVYLALNALFDRPVRACANTLTVKPLTSFGVGLLVLLLVGPVCLLLAVSVVGIVVVPFVFCTLLVGWIVGKVAVARWIGMSVVPESEDSRAHGARSLIIGFVLITLAYMIPVLGLVTWAIIGVLGLGTAALAFMSAYRRENPKPIAVPPDVAPPPPPPVPAPYVPPASAATAEPPPSMAYEAMPQPGAPAVAAAVPLTAPPAAVLVGMPRALFRDRLAAFVLDVMLVLISVTVLNVDGEDAFLPMLLVYHIGFWTWKQTTVGGLVTQLRVVRVDGAPLSFADALVRGLASIFSIAVFFLGALWILRDPERQAWHDKIAGTYIVKVPRNWPL